MLKILKMCLLNSSRVMSEEQNNQEIINMKRDTQLFDLYWEDILVAKVLPHLTLKECFTFRCVSKTCLQITDMYFAKLKSLKFMKNEFSPHTFSVSVCNKRLYACK